MIKALLILLAAAVLGLVLAASRISTVTGERDTAQDAADKAQASVGSLRGTLRLQRELASDQDAIESTYIEEKQRAEDDAEYYRRCLADGSCGLRVAASLAPPDLDDVEQPEPVKLPAVRLLRNTENGRDFAWTPELAKLPNMKEL